MPWIAGQQLQNGQYVIEKVLGRGGFGITYKALQIGLSRPVVIKTPDEHLSHDPEYEKYIQRFIKEGKILARLSQDPHPHIVGVIDLFQEGNTHCLVMEFVEGENLFEAVKSRGALPEVEIVRCIRQIGEALVKVHKAGLVHRDAHPGNIMLRKNGEAVLIDFGIAKELLPQTVSSTGNAGNHGFAPYEQMTRGSREPTVDIYCLTATLYYAVTCQLPTNSLARKLENIPLKPPKEITPSISNQLNQAILKGMALEAQDRPQSMQAWLAMLEAPRTKTPVIVERVYTKEVVYPQGKLQSDTIPDKPATKSPEINHYKSAIKSPTIIRYQPATQSHKIIPWFRLVGILFIYIFLGYVFALALYKASLLQIVSIGILVWGCVWVFVWTVAIAGTWTWAKAWVWFVAGAWAWVVASTGFGAWAWVWAWVLASTQRKLEQSFDNFHTFLVLISTSGLGLGLGFLGHRIFSIGS